MPIGAQDWSRSGLSANVAVGYDTSELAVRLGSSVNFDRTGKVLFQDNFTRLDNGWTFVKTGLTTDPIIDTVRAEYYGSSLKFVIGIGAANNCAMAHNGRVWLNSILGYECGLYVVGSPSAVLLTFTHYDDTGGYSPELYLYNNCTRLAYYDENQNFIDLDSFSSNIFSGSFWHTLKLDIDTENKNYIRMRLDHNSYDLKDIPFWRFAGTYYGSVDFRLTVWGNAANAVTAYVDRIIITEDE